MKKFRFTMQALLGVKLTLEKQSKAELAACQARLQTLLEQLAELERRREQARQDYNRKMERGGVKPTDMEVYAVGFRAFKEQIEHQQELIEAAEGERRRLQKKVVEVMSERKMLEKLKEKQYEEYREDSRREEAKEIDDFLSNKVSAGGDRHGR